MATTTLLAASVFELAARLTISVLVIIVAVWAVRWLARRGGGTFLGGRQDIGIVARRSVGRKASLLLVEVGDQTLLIGATEHSISTLATGDDLTPEITIDELADTDVKAAGFSGALGDAMRRQFRTKS